MDKYGLEDRTYNFAKRVRLTLKNLQPGTTCNDDMVQLIRSSGSVGANFIEAKESLSKRDFLMRIKICRKEAQESTFWLRLLMEGTETPVHPELRSILQEARELTCIFGSIVSKLERT